MSINIKKLLFAGVVLLFAGVGLVLAQNRYIRPIEECTTAEKAKLLVLFTENEVAEGYVAIVERAKESLVDDIDDILEDTIEWRQAWYENVAPEMPDCAAAKRLQIVYGQIVDDLSLSMSLIKIVFEEPSLRNNFQQYSIDLIASTTELLKEAGDIIRAMS